MKKAAKTLVKTPKGRKNIPKKVIANKIPLKKDEAPKTPKTIINIPKSDKKTPMQNANATEKQGKHHQQKTLQKDNTTHQNKPSTPKIPKSDLKKRKRSPRYKANKKLKLDNNKSKEIISVSDDKRNENATTNSNKSITSLNASTERLARVRVSFPNSEVVASKDLQQLFEGCENVVFHQSVVIEYNPKIASQKVEQLRKIRITRKPLNISTVFSQPSVLKRIIKMVNYEDQEKTKKFYNAKSIENLVMRSGKPSRAYLLTFETEKEAMAASEKKFNLNNKILELMPYFENEDSGSKPTVERKVGSARQEQTRKLSEDKQKLEQKKRRANEEELDEKWFLDCEGTLGGIEMDMDDDYEEEKD